MVLPRRYVQGGLTYACLYGILYRGDMGARTIAVCFTREAAAVELSLCGRDGERDHASNIDHEGMLNVLCTV